jgi:hypothetical protein
MTRLRVLLFTLCLAAAPLVAAVPAPAHPPDPCRAATADAMAKPWRMG